MKISREIHIKAPVEKVYTTYADILKWKSVMDDVLDINIFYNDSRHQEFDMTVKRGERTETVHSIRFCYPHSSIEIFQTKPPPLFKSMTGVWKFEKVNDGTLVSATRIFAIKDGMDFDPEILGVFLQKNIESFKNWIETNA